ncbi:putative TIR domain, P-loop containing nucleoside triphosphate hydrolase [Helianthus annuus]|nr:putative TIR domain, P-loop containing nucleoside triphosphate hydrolase [Helianthus annuus]
MASSSSSSHSVPPASISQSWNYDVFLSFRGEDTRKSFVDHLYAALEQQGIHTYKDDKTLARGESIGPALLKAIQESRIAVIVFSKNYADSSWCLDELAHIMECLDTRGQIVMPIFYHVDPSDLRKLKRKYGEAFGKHSVGENKQKVESWRKALEKAGNLSGWVIDENSHEAKCIKEIVGTISSRLPTLTTNVNKDLIGIETRLQDLKSKLKMESGGVGIIGIWGVGGGGKTTLASAAYAEISHRFEAHCLLQNIREESNKHGLEKLQEKFLSLILKADVKIGSEIEGRSMIERSLRNKSVLVVLDDVDDVKQLEALAVSHAWFGKGSRIIITTRDEHLLTRHADTIYEVSLLSDDEAMELFNKYAYRKDKPIEDYKMLSKDVVSYASGLPLALEILGSFLYDKNKDEWKSALAKLKCIPNVKVTERLKISYDGLEPDHQKLFLDIACFFRRRSMDEAMMVLDACNLHPCIGVKVLIQKSLIKVSNNQFGDKRVDMHDLVEEMAHYIVRGEHPNHPEKQSRIWKREDIAYLCDMGADAVPMETEVVAFHDYFGAPDLSDVVANMKKLRWISLDYYLVSSFPSNFQPRELRYLGLQCSKQKELWHGYKSLPNLKTLDLHFSKNLITTPDFEGLPCLERLILKGCVSLEEIHPSIGYHKRLVYVDMSDCRALKRFPPIIQMQMLETLNLSTCIQLQEFPDIQSNKSLPNLKILDLKSSRNLIKTPDFDGLPCLERLILKYCWSLEEIHPSIGYHKRLVFVDMSYCQRLKRFPPIIHMKKLETLDLSYCSKLQQFPDIQSNKSLPNLKFLNLEHCGNLITTPDFEGLPCLERLISSWCNSLVEIHPSIGYHKRLVFVDMSCCARLKRFPPIIHMKKLETLDLSCCYKLQQFPDIQSNMDSLVTLDLSCTRIKIIPPLYGRLPDLKFLDLSNCWNLVELPDLPSSIAILQADDCPSLEIVRDLSDYKWLWKVSLWGCYKLIGGERVLHSMLEGNAAKGRFMSLLLPMVKSSSRIFTRLVTLQLPSNWFCHDIDIKRETPTYDYSEESDEDWEQCKYERVGYVPFNSLRHIPWLNPTYTKNISFHTRHCGLNVELVRSKNKIVDLNENPIDYSECWDEEYDEDYIKLRKAFEIMYDSQSSNIRILWRH